MVDVTRSYTIPLPLDRIPNHNLPHHELTYRMRVTVKYDQILELLTGDNGGETMLLLGAHVEWSVIETSRTNYREKEKWFLLDSAIDFESYHIGKFLNGIAHMERAFELLEYRQTGKQ